MSVAHRMLQVCGQVFTYAIITQRVTNNQAVSLQGATKPWVKQNRATSSRTSFPISLKTLDAYDGTLLTRGGEAPTYDIRSYQ